MDNSYLIVNNNGALTQIDNDRTMHISTCGFSIDCNDKWSIKIIMKIISDVKESINRINRI